MRKRPRVVGIKIRLYPGQDDDLIRWLEQFDGQAYGVKSHAIKEALRRGIGQGHDTPAPVVDLAEIRQVVEAAVATALARFEGKVVGAVPVVPEEDEETEELLDNLGSEVMI